MYFVNICFVLFYRVLSLSSLQRNLYVRVQLLSAPSITICYWFCFVDLIFSHVLCVYLLCFATQNLTHFGIRLLAVWSVFFVKLLIFTHTHTHITRVLSTVRRHWCGMFGIVQNVSVSVCFCFLVRMYACVSLYIYAFIFTDICRCKDVWFCDRVKYLTQKGIRPKSGMNVSGWRFETIHRICFNICFFLDPGSPCSDTNFTSTWCRIRLP